MQSVIDFLDTSYGIIEETYDYGLGVHKTYGIAAYINVAGELGTTVVASAHNLSPDREVVDNLVRLCNGFQLSIIHFQDVIDNFFGELCDKRMSDY